VKILWYLPFIPRIQRLFMTEESTKQMTWHKNGKRYSPEKMVHSFDGEAGQHFDRIHHNKAGKAHNIRVALATDGFNPYGMMAAPYSCWPMFVIPLNLPPGVAFQRQNVFLSLIIPKHPGNNMGVFMEPLFDELVHAWDHGVWTYDRATKMSTSSGSAGVYQRGPSSLPVRSIPVVRRSILQPLGQAYVTLHVTTTLFDMLRITTKTNSFSEPLTQGLEGCGSRCSQKVAQWHPGSPL
jgi:hypothetical protein